MSKCCVYMVNQHPLYMNMAYNSICMLRKHSNIPVRIFFIKDKAKLTFSNDRTYPGLEADISDEGLIYMSERFVQKTRDLDVQVEERTSHSSESMYIHANQAYMEDCVEDTVLFIDADTFVFGNVEAIADDYMSYDVVALEAEWIRREAQWNPAWFEHQTPLTTCLMLFHRKSAAKWARFLPSMCREYRDTDSDLSRWITQRKFHHLREELSLTPFVIRHNLRWRLFNPEHCCQINRLALQKSIVFHCYAYDWLNFYNFFTRNSKLPLVE